MPRKRGKHGQFLPNFDEEKFLQLYMDGLSDSEIAKKMNCGQPIVCIHRNKMKLRFNPSTRQQKSIENIKRAFFLFKIKQMNFNQIGLKLRISERKAQEYVGFAIMANCRIDKNCPYKVLLPENVHK